MKVFNLIVSFFKQSRKPRQAPSTIDRWPIVFSVGPMLKPRIVVQQTPSSGAFDSSGEMLLNENVLISNTFFFFFILTSNSIQTRSAAGHRTKMAGRNLQRNAHWHPGERRPMVDGRQRFDVDQWTGWSMLLLEFRLVRLEHTDFAPSIEEQHNGTDPQNENESHDEDLLGAYNDLWAICCTKTFDEYLKNTF